MNKIFLFKIIILSIIFIFIFIFFKYHYIDTKKNKTFELNREITLNFEKDKTEENKKNIVFEKDKTKENKKIYFPKQESSEKFKNTLDKKKLVYEKDNFLPYYYVPDNLKKIDKRYLVYNKEIFLINEAKVNLEKMIHDSGFDIKVISAYRSYSTQENIKLRKIKLYGKKRADEYSADPGQSEHQLGTTVDLSVKKVNFRLVQSFENTPEFLWLKKNSNKYGFKISYPEGNKNYKYEPWHFRYWGTDSL